MSGPVDAFVALLVLVAALVAVYLLGFRAGFLHAHQRILAYMAKVGFPGAPRG